MNYPYFCTIYQNEMKIVLVGPAYPYRGGLATVDERLAREFEKEGDRIEIQTFTLQYPSFLFPGKTQYTQEENKNTFPIERSINTVNPFNWIKVGLKLKRHKPDFIITRCWLPFMSPCFGTIALIARKNGHTKHIALTDNIIPHEKRMMDRLFTKYLARSVDGWIAMSENVHKDIRLFDRQSPAVVTPHPLYDNFGSMMDKAEAVKTLGLNPENINLLFFGLIRPYKGLDLLIEAMADERLKDCPLHLTVAGEFYEDSSKYERLISEYSLENKITLENRFVPNEEVRRYFCASDLLVLPYKSATQSGVTQIALYFSLPMLVTNVGGLAEVVEDGVCGYVCEPRAEDIARSLERFCKERQDFSEGLAQARKKYSWSTMTKAMKDMYNKISTP